MRGPIDVDSVSGLVSLVVCVLVEGVLEVDEANFAVCIVLDFDVDGLGVDTGKRRRGVEVVVVGTCANLEVRWRVLASVAKRSVHSGDEVHRLELVSWQGLEFVSRQGSVDEGDGIVRVLGDLLRLKRALEDLVVFNERVVVEVVGGDAVQVQSARRRSARRASDVALTRAA